MKITQLLLVCLKYDNEYYMDDYNMTLNPWYIWERLLVFLKYFDTCGAALSAGRYDDLYV